MTDARGRQLGLPNVAHALLDMEALRQTALSNHAISKRAVALCAIGVFFSRPPAERDAWLRSLLPVPSIRPFRSLELPVALHLDIELEAARLSGILGTPIGKGAVVAAAVQYYQHLPEDQRPSADRRTM